MLSNGLDGMKSALSQAGVFLVRKLLFDMLDGSERMLMHVLWKRSKELFFATTARKTGTNLDYLEKDMKTHFVGASCSSMSPLINEAMLPAAALVSSAVLEMVSCFNRSSSTLTDF